MNTETTQAGRATTLSTAEQSAREEPIDIVDQYDRNGDVYIESADSQEFQEKQEELGRYLADAARWEIGRTTGISTAVTGTFAAVGTGVSILAAFGSKQILNLGSSGNVAMAAFGLAANLMFVALVLILRTLRSVPTKWHPSRNLTGWPTLTNPNRTDRIARFRQSARTPAVFYREDATKLAEIANGKHGKLRLANLFAVLGTIVFAIGVDVLIVAMLFA